MKVTELSSLTTVYKSNNSNIEVLDIEDVPHATPHPVLDGKLLKILGGDGIYFVWNVGYKSAFEALVLTKPCLPPMLNCWN